MVDFWIPFQTMSFSCDLELQCVKCAALMPDSRLCIRGLCKYACEMYHVLVRGYSGMVLPDTVVLDHLLQSCVEALGAQPVTPLALQLLLSLEKDIGKCSQIQPNKVSVQEQERPISVIAIPTGYQ